MTQYELWWADLSGAAGRRPVLLLSREAASEFLSRFVAAEVTTRVRRVPQEVVLGPGEGLDRRCAANFDNLRTVDRAQLEERIGTLSPKRVPEVKRALGYVLGWPELTLQDR